jgi:sugar-specific transcriptional regulator TrmB
MNRLCVESGADYSVKPYPDGQLLHVVHVHSYDKDLDILSRFKKYRSESLSIFVRNLSLIPTSFALFSIPAFLFQGVPDFVVLVLSLTVMTHLYILIRDSSSRLLNGALAFFPLSIFPYTYWTFNGCAELYALPWILNSALGALLFGAYTTTALLSRWLPGLLMILGCSCAILLLPDQCKSLLNGTTPGIVIVLVIARYLMILRNRNFKLDTELDAFIKDQSRADEIVLNRISEARSRVISSVHEYLDRQFDNVNSSAEGSRLINFIRCYLLCSEKIDDDFISEFFDWISHRYNNGLDTSLEIYQFDDSNLPSNFRFEEISSLIDEVYGSSKIHVILDSSEQLSLEVLGSEKIENHVAMQANRFLPHVHLRFSRQ